MKLVRFPIATIPLMEPMANHMPLSPIKSALWDIKKDKQDAAPLTNPIERDVKKRLIIFLFLANKNMQ